MKNELLIVIKNMNYTLHRDVILNCYPANWMHKLIDGCSFLMWVGEGSIACTVIALYQIQKDLFIVYVDFNGSCSGCGNKLEDYGIDGWIKDVLPFKLKSFKNLEDAKAEVMANFGLLSKGDYAEIRLNLINLDVDLTHCYVDNEPNLVYGKDLAKIQEYIKRVNNVIYLRMLIKRKLFIKSKTRDHKLSNMDHILSFLRTIFYHSRTIFYLKDYILS